MNGAVQADPTRRLGLVLAGLGMAFVVLVTRQLGVGAEGSYAISGDAHYLYLSARSLAFDGDLDLSNQYLVFGDRWGLGRDPADDGWRFPPREIGPALLMVPGLWLHHLLGLPASWGPTMAVLVPAASMGALFPVLARALGELGHEARERAWLALAGTLGFFVPYYSLGRVGYAHAPDAVACALLALALLRRRPAAVVGLCLAVAVLFRLQNFLWLAWPLFEAVRGPDRASGLRRVASIAGVGLLGLLPFAWLGLAHPGSKQGAIRWGLDFFDLDGYLGDLLEVTIGTHGLFTWTPLAVVAVLGLVAARRVMPETVWPAILILGANLLLLASVRDPTGGWAFGARRLSGCTVLLTIGLGLSITARGGGLFSRLLIGALVTVNLVLTGLALNGSISLAP